MLGLNEPIIAEKLVLDNLEPGKKYRLWIEMIADLLGTPVRVPVVVVRGAKPGPVLGLMAALHGNELNGISVAQDIFGKLRPNKLSGTFVAVCVANVPAYQRQQRKFTDGVDLNHIMPGQPHGNISQVYAYRLVERIVRSFDYLIDLHTASFGRINSLYVRADLTNPVAARMAYLQRPQIIVNDPPYDGTLRGTAMEAGIPAITVEIGNPQRFQRSLIRSTTAGIRAVLAELGMLSSKIPAEGAEPTICSHSYWTYTDEGGLLHVIPKVTQAVTRGELIAELVDPFGDPVEQYFAPEDGVVIGKSVNPAAQTGARILHLGIIEPNPIQEMKAPEEV